MAENGHTGQPPQRILKELAALMVEAEKARARAQTAHQLICSAYGLPSSRVVRLVASIEPESRGGP